MEVTWLSTSLSLLFLLFALSIFLQRRRPHPHLPPSPPAVPILGHLHLLLKQPIHRHLQTLSQKYGPIFSLRFGSRLLVIISSPSTVEECFTKNDIIFANRPCFLFGKYIDYNYTTIASAPYGKHWRNLRRLSTLEIFSTNRLNMFLGIRRDEIKLLLRQLSRNSRDNSVRVELRPMFIELTCNIIMRMVAGKRYYGEAVDFEEAKHFREVMRGIFELAGGTNPGNFLLSLRWVYFGGYEKELVKINRMKEVIFQGLIDEHRSPTGLVNKNTMIDHLLSMQKSEPQYYTDEIIKGLALDLILAGTDTTATTIEWAMSLLLNHPDILKKARVELDTLVGKDRLMEESDFPKLQCLQNIISETLRLFPAAPLLVPHMSSENSQIGGFDIPRDTILLANVWAIHRDPKLWKDATSFKPERFENIGETETYKLLPFGLGRRACPGVGLANRVVGLALGSLIQCYEWERVSEKEVDMVEGKGKDLLCPKWSHWKPCAKRVLSSERCYKTMKRDLVGVKHYRSSYICVCVYCTCISSIVLNLVQE